MEDKITDLSPLHMIRKKTFGFPRCGLLAYHAAETPDQVLSDMKLSVVTAGSQVFIRTDHGFPWNAEF